MPNKIFVLLLCSVLFLTGCKQDTLVGNDTPQQDETIVQEAETEEYSNEVVDDPDTGTDGMTEEISENTIRETENVSLVMNQTNGNEKVSITMIGLNQYDSLESETYTDTPEDGNVYLVMFLNVSNHDSGDDYFNPESLSAKVDGKEISHSVLFNQPESYEPLFDHINTGEERTGYIVWQVPSDWKEFRMEYDGWTEMCALNVTATVTPEMLCTPPVLD